MPKLYDSGILKLDKSIMSLIIYMSDYLILYEILKSYEPEDKLLMLQKDKLLL